MSTGQRKAKGPQQQDENGGRKGAKGLVKQPVELNEQLTEHPLSAAEPDKGIERPGPDALLSVGGVISRHEGRSELAKEQPHSGQL